MLSLRSNSRTRIVRAVLGLAGCLGAPVALAAPQISEPFASRFQIAPALPASNLFAAAQTAFGPDGRLYATQIDGDVVSYAFNPATGLLSDKQPTGIHAAVGIAFATHAVPGGAARPYMYVTRMGDFMGNIERHSDDNGNYRWGESGEVNVTLVAGIPVADHTLDQLQIHNNQLFVGIGTRTSNGRTGIATGTRFRDEPAGPVNNGGFANGGDGFTYGETSYNGTIGTIRDLSLVPNSPNAAQLRDGPNGTTGNLLAGRDAFLPASPTATMPLTSTAQDKLVVHSAGTRNPFGLAVDAGGNLWFTNNHSRSNTNGDGTSNPNLFDFVDDDLSNDVHDQLFRAVPGGDYRYDNTNFRGTPGFPTLPVRSVTFDNLDADHPAFGNLHDPANPDGLGPSSSANGLDFGTLDLTGLLATDAREYGLIARWNGTVTAAPPGTDSLTFRDVVVVDPETGQLRRLAEGFLHPIDVENDGAGGFLVADFGFPGVVWRITPRASSSRWNINSTGPWSDPANWSGPVPDAPGAVANLTGAIDTDTQVLLDSPRVVGTVNFDNLNGYHIAGSATLTLDVDAGYAAVNALRGNHAISVPVALADRVVVAIAPGSTLVIAAMTGDARLNKGGGGTLSVGRFALDELSIESGRVGMSLPASANAASRVNSLEITGGQSPLATLDLGLAALVIDYTGASPITTIAAQIAHAYNGGAWDRPGITSTVAGPTTAVGFAEAAALEITAFHGVAVDGDSIVLRTTRAGDANLDGIVNIGDFSLLASSFNQPGMWWRGDFNHDGVANLADFALLAVNFNAGFMDDLPMGRSAVPEPAGVAMLMAGFALRRQKRIFAISSGPRLG